MVSTHKIGDDLGMLSMAWGESHVIVPSTLNTPYIVINDVYVSYKKTIVFGWCIIFFVLILNRIKPIIKHIGSNK